MKKVFIFAVHYIHNWRENSHFHCGLFLCLDDYILRFCTPVRSVNAPSASCGVMQRDRQDRIYFLPIKQFFIVMTKLTNKVAERENYASSQATAHARNASHPTQFTPINENLLKFDPVAISAVNFLTAALSECQRYEEILPGRLSIQETIYHIKNSITAVLGMEIDRIDSIIQNNYQ